MSSIAIKFLALGAVAIAANGFVGSTVSAQQVFRTVGPDGKVTFSDKPPPASGTAAAPASSVSSNPSAAASGAALPFELRQVVAKYPVTLYTGNNCNPCGSARSMLITRGVPFVEKTILTVEDTQALERISGDNSLPFATIGGQQLKGFSDIEWTQFLTAAGYPASTVLPSNYRPAAATPLVAAVSVPPAAANGSTTAPIARPAAAQPPASASQPALAPSNPSGIRF